MNDVRFSVLPEWAPQSAVWAGWPHIRGEWGAPFEAARSQITDFLKALCAVTPVKVACGSREAYGSAYFALEAEIEAGRVSLHTLPTGDIWLRDTGPIFGGNNDALHALGFKFNGWGGKYIMPGDTLTNNAIAVVEQAQFSPHEFILEGGAVDFDGNGRLLTTRQCVLNSNRNPDWSATDAERALKDAFGVSQIIWLDDGLLNDHTDGHVDNIARFIAPGVAVCQTASGPDDPNADVYLKIETQLREAGISPVLIPSPGRIEDENQHPIPASHMNFLISNQHIFLPVYEDAHAPLAAKALEAAMPDFKVICLPANAILSGGGSFHCMTQQVPVI